jgi:hypothetical protein
MIVSFLLPNVPSRRALASELFVFKPYKFVLCELKIWNSYRQVTGIQGTSFRKIFARAHIVAGVG